MLVTIENIHLERKNGISPNAAGRREAYCTVNARPEHHFIEFGTCQTRPEILDRHSGQNGGWIETRKWDATINARSTSPER